ncbi:MAG: hypothetical protein Q8L27_04615 [archaeon]|nr:hypothetical protein [archaeon]
MLSEKQILEIAHEALRTFKIHCEIKFLSYPDYKSVAMESPLISQVLEDGFSFEELKIPALVKHDLHEHIYLSKKIISVLLRNKPVTVQKKFIKAMLYHELFHIRYRDQIKKANYLECQKSEDVVCKEFEKEHPDLYKIGFEIHKKATEI